MDGKNFSPALLRALLHTGNVQVTFTKADETTRVMPCTLKLEDVKPDYDEPLGDSLTVWALDVQAWRRFRFDRVTDVVVL